MPRKSADLEDEEFAADEDITTTAGELTAAEQQDRFSIGLSEPGADIPDGARRVSCPDCGAKHDVARSDVAPGQGGTWTVPQFTCAAGCGYAHTDFPVA